MKIYSKNPRMLLNDLAREAMLEPLVYCNDHAIQRAIWSGKEIPDRLKPGASIMKLPLEARETLMKLTSDDVKNSYVFNLT